jgi:hypothetical protein
MPKRRPRVKLDGPQPVCESLVQVSDCAMSPTDIPICVKFVWLQFEGVFEEDQSLLGAPHLQVDGAQP